MAKIYPDTNRFVDFYGTSQEKLVRLDELLKNKGSLVLTEQTINEFRRNRVGALNRLAKHFEAKQFQEENDVGTRYSATLLEDLPLHKELARLLVKVREKREEVRSHLKQLGVVRGCKHRRSRRCARRRNYLCRSRRRAVASRRMSS